MQVPTMALLSAEGKKPEILFWVGCAGSFDDRAQRVTRAFTKILMEAGVDFGILGNEETCTGDPARRAGNEFLFQMSALQNIEAQLLQELIDDGKVKMKEGGSFQGKKITYHDSCYLGRANGIYEAPRKVLEALDADLAEMKRCKTTGLCCGAGGAQMWKEDEAGDKRINMDRTDEALATGAEVIAVNCPFCLTMMSDGVKANEKQEEVMVLDLAELIVQNNS